MRSLSALAATFAVQADGRAQLLPAGEFAARDGRPGPGKTWRLTDAQGQALAARINARAARTPLVVDYDHQTLPALLGQNSGKPAPAAGWIAGVEWRDGEGLFGRVDWTERAKGLIQAREYLYFSPVIAADDETGEVLDVLLGALVNYPALLGMEPVSAALMAQLQTLSQTPGALEAAEFETRLQRALQGNANPPLENPRMSKLALSATTIAALAAMLTLQAGATEDDLVAGIKALKDKADKPGTPALPVALAGELGLQPTAAEADVLAAITAIKAQASAGAGANTTALAGAMSQIAALSTQVQQLQAVRADAQLADAVDAAIAADKAVPAMRDQLLEVGRKAGLQALQAMLTAMPAIPGLSGQATGGAAAAAAVAAAATRVPQIAALQGAEGLRVAKAMGIAPDAWAAHLATLATPAATH
jgi:phage I-like protein